MEKSTKMLSAQELVDLQKSANSPRSGDYYFSDHIIFQVRPANSVSYMKVRVVDAKSGVIYGYISTERTDQREWILVATQEGRPFSSQYFKDDVSAVTYLQDGYSRRSAFKTMVEQQ